MANKNKVILGVTPLTEKILCNEFPLLDKANLPSYNISYSTILPLWFKLFLQLPRIKKVIRAEHNLLEELIHKYQLDTVISDNRYGLFHEKVKSVMICHQTNLQTPFLKRFLNKLHVKYLKKFDEIWVPDYEKESDKLAGELGMNKYSLNCRYIGPLSRLKQVDSNRRYDYLFLLSGPEPSQSDLLKKLISKANSTTTKKIAIVTSSNTNIQVSTNSEVVELPSAELLSQLIAKSETIICRSGYSTLMDLHLLKKKKLILIPTKGQTEQEYLARYWNKKFGSILLKESDIINYQL